MNTKMITLGLIVVFFAMTTAALAEDVYISGKGSKYHKEDCRLLKNKDQVQTLDKTDAIAQGYTPCKRCFKEDLVQTEKKDQIEDQSRPKTQK